MTRAHVSRRRDVLSVASVLLAATLLLVTAGPLGPADLAAPGSRGVEFAGGQATVRAAPGAPALSVPSSQVGWNASIPQWRQLAPPSSPPPRADAAMAFDPQLNVTVLFGGSYSGGSCFVFTTCALNDTWEFDGARWTNVTPTHLTSTTNPSPRWGAALAYVPALGGLLLFGGTSATPNGINNPALNDTWEFSGLGWAPLCTGLCAAPAARWDASFAYSDEAGAAVLFGGETTVSGTTSDLSDTWTFTPTANWTPVTPAAAPSARAAAPEAWDGQLGGVVLFGGSPSNTQTWLYRNQSWHVLSPALSSGIPSARAGAALSNDPLNGSVVLFGGCAAVPCAGTGANDTWVLAQDNWFNLTGRIGPAPSGRGQADLSLGGAKGSLVLFGGSGGALDNDTWRLAHLELTAVTAAPSALDVGNSTNLSVSVSGGIGSTAFAWIGLPVGCASANASALACTPTGPGGENATVRVMVTDTGGFVVNSTPVLLTVNARPTATVVATPLHGIVPLQVSFVVTARGGTGSLSFAWQFGDGTTGTGPNPSHAYLSAGTYPIVVQATDGDDQTGTAWTNVTVVARLSATAEFSPTAILYGASATLKVAISGGTGPYTVHPLNATPGCGTVPSGTTNAQSFRCTPTDVGTYRLTLRVNDSSGQSVNVTANLTVNASSGPGGPSPPASSSPLSPTEELGIVVVIVLVALLGLALYLRRRGRQPVVPPAGPPGPMPPANLYVPPEDAHR